MKAGVNVDPLERLRGSSLLKGKVPHFTLNRLIDAVGWALISPFWLKHIQLQGAPLKVIGGLEALYNLLLMLQIVGGQLSDSVGRKKMMVTAYVLSLAGIVFVLSARSWVWLLVPVALWGLADSFINPVTGVYFAEIAGEHEEGTAFSLLSLTWFLPGLFAPTLAALIMERSGFTALAWILLATESIAFVVLLVWIPETLKETKPVKLKTMVRTILDTIKPRAGLASFYALALLDSFTYGLFAPFLVIIFTDYMGYTGLQSGVLINVVTLMIPLLLIPMGRLIDAYGGRRMITLYTVTYAASTAIYLLTGSYHLMIAAQFLRGIALSIWNPVYGAYLYASVEPEQRSTYFGNLNALRSLIMLPAPLLGTYILASYGHRAVFAAVLLGSITMTILSLRLEPVKENGGGSR